MRVSDSDELVLEVGELPVDEIATFEIVRFGEEQTIEVRIGERESEAAIANLNTRLWPGFSTYPLTEELRRESEIDDSITGVVVSTVENRTPGAAAGLRVGDIITEIDGSSIRDLRGFFRAINVGGSSVELVVNRDGEEEALQLQR